VVLEHALETLLRECKRASDVGFQALYEVLARLIHKRLLARVLDAVDCHIELQPLEALVCFDVLEGFLQGLFRGVAWKGFEDRGWVGGAHLADRGIDGVGAAREEGDGEVSVGRRGENSGDACALNIGELNAIQVED
jgi:hypothetical protein